MLLRFQVTNHRSIHAPVELSMIAVDDDRSAARNIAGIDESVLTVGAIYGPNASGKSNVLDAVDWLVTAVGTSLHTWGSAIPCEPFRFSTGTSEPTTFVVDVTVEGVRYSYHLELTSNEVLSESLAYYPHRRRNMLFERSGTAVSLGRDLRGASGIRELTVPTTLAISSALRLDIEPVARCARMLAAIATRSSTRRPHLTEESTQWWLSSRQVSLFDDNRVPTGPDHESAIRMLQAADLGISDVEFVFDGRSMRTRFTHSASSQQLYFDEDDESIGTLVWFELIGPILTALRHGRVLLIDELDASLHPALSERVVEMFQDPLTNPRGAQLLFTSHDTSLLTTLKRDEVWFTEKEPDGSTKLTALADFRLRKEQNIERSYVQGRFGAIPDVKDHLVLEALRVGG